MVPFCVLEPTLKKAGFLFQSPQNSQLTFIGEQNARASMKGEEHEQATFRQHNGL
jgi:hypothetical protein